MTNDKIQMTNKLIKSQSLNYLLIKRFIWVLSFGFWISILILPANAAQVSSTDLLNKPDLYNGKIVIFEGEAVGDILENWINVNDGNNAIGIFVREKIALDEISYLGDYKKVGDKLKITGQFNKACAEHGGDLDIHAEHLEVTALGHPINHPFDLSKLYSLLILLGVTVFVYIIKTILHKKK
ncbi:MAG: DNA-binding protein [Candidatus Saganbacteria bacterium]|nr:DNA-binding protein [Candidatus Saganbacteria bacterium]